MATMHEPFEFSKTHIKDRWALAAKICDSDDPASYRIRSILGSLEIQAIHELVSARNLEELDKLLVEILNSLLVAPYLYSPVAFDSLGITRISSDDPDADPTEELVRFNHHLLQAAYPDELQEIVEDFVNKASETKRPDSRSVNLGTSTDSVNITGDNNRVLIGVDDSLALSEFEVSETAMDDTIATFVPPINEVLPASPVLV